MEQGLEMYGADVEFRVLLRDPSHAGRFGHRVTCVRGDVRDIASIRRACEGFTPDSLVFDGCTSIDLSSVDEDGAIMATNLTGARNVIAVSKELGLTMHKAHSMAGLASPRTGAIREDTPPDQENEEPIYAALPYLRAKREVTRDLLQAQADGQRLLFTYLVTPWGPYSRADALANRVIAFSARTRRYPYAKDVSIAYVDARDAASVHWLAYMNDVQDHFVLSCPLKQAELLSFFAEATGTELRAIELSASMMRTAGKTMDLLGRWVFRKTKLPLSEAVARLMFANNAYSSDKAKTVLGFEPRPAAHTFHDHFQDLANRGLIDTRKAHRRVSVW